MSRSRIFLGAVALGAVLVGMPAGVHGQVFFGSQPKSGLIVTPLFIVAGVSPDSDGVAIEIMFSVLIPPGKSALDFEQDLYLLWPGQVAAASAGASAISLPPDVAAQLTTIGEGRVRLEAKRSYESTADSEPLGAGAPFITVVRPSGAMGVSPAATYIRIPWSPRLANQAWLTSVQVTAKDVLKPKATTWLGRVVSGPRSVLALGFNDIGSPAAFSMYYWQRDNVLPVASPGRLVANFAGAGRLAIDTIFPAAARREASPSVPDTDVVSLFLTNTGALIPEVLRIEFGYFSRLQSWGPILVPALFFALGNGAGVLVRNVTERLSKRWAGRLQFGGVKEAPKVLTTGVVLDAEMLRRIVPGRTTHEEVLRLLGNQVEEHSRLTAPEQKTLVYRGRRLVPSRRRALGFMATVEHWDAEEHEVTIDLERDVVRDVQARVRRSRVSAPEPA